MSNGYTTKYLQTSKHMYIWITNTLLLIPPYKIQTYWHICITINSDISLRVIWWMYIYTCWWYKCWWGCMHVYSIWTHYILRKKRNHRICDDDNNNGTKWVMLCFLLVHAFMPFLCLLSLSFDFAQQESAITTDMNTVFMVVGSALPPDVVVLSSKFQQQH